MSLTPDKVHLIRTSGLTDSHWATTWRMSVHAIRSARVGDTWASHPTPPDVRARYKGGRNAAPKARIRNG